MPYTERPDIAVLGSMATNAAVYGESTIAYVQESFGASKQPLFLYNVSVIEFNEPRYPNHPHMLLRACPKDKEYLLVGQIEHPFSEISYDQNDNKIIRLTDGRREATRMLSPLNPGTDQNFDAPDAFNVGGNLNSYGCFWSEHNPPLEAEVAAAKARMEKTFRAELEKLAAVEAKNPDDARAMANKISHAAAEYYGVSTSWHRSDLIPSNKDKGKVDCWACGEKIQAKALLCIHCKAPQAEEKRDGWLEAQTMVRKMGKGS